jgi:FAD-dependent urate hydroxylase
MTDTVAVAIVGAGPYGLSLAAHLRAANTSHLVIGRPMASWRDDMPAGMFLKSQPMASHLSDPDHTHGLDAYYGHMGLPYQAYGQPVPLDRFVDYGTWFQQALVPDVVDTSAAVVRQVGNEFELDVGDRFVRAHAVVLATGVAPFARVPTVLQTLSAAHARHSGAVGDLGQYRGLDVTVVGAGQAALETAALLMENGARARVLARRPAIAWNSDPLSLVDRSIIERVREPVAGLGSGWRTYFYSSAPAQFRRLPAPLRQHVVRRALGPAGASWLRPRFEGVVEVVTGCQVIKASMAGAKVSLDIADSTGQTRQLLTDQVIAATGYRVDVSRLSALDPDILTTLAERGPIPALSDSFESRIPGLFLVGPVAANTFGPVMRFVYGADFAARRLSRRLRQLPDHHLVAV